MADLVVKQHDTYPYLRGLAKDEEGVIDLLSADKLKVILKHQTTGDIVEGIAKALDPEEDKEHMNWEYKWAAGDTDIPGIYNCELEITKDENTIPPEVQTVPNGKYATVEIKADLA